MPRESDLIYTREMMMRRGAGVCLLALAVAFSPSSSGNARATDSLPSAEVLFERTDAPYARMEQFSYRVKRTIVSPKQTTADEWVFSFKKPDKMRFDYRQDFDKVIALDGTYAVEYIAPVAKAMKTNLTRLSTQERTAHLAGLTKRLTVDGLRIGDASQLAKRAVRVERRTAPGGDLLVVEGADPKYVIGVDASHAVIRLWEMFDRKGSLLMRTETSGLLQAGPDFWVPEEIRSSYKTKEGPVTITVILSEARTDIVQPASFFSFEPPIGTKVISN